MKLAVPFVSLTLCILISACNDNDTPVASFDFSPESIEVGDSVYFHSTCQYAHTFDWDFGDGSGSSEENPIHVYTLEGDLTIRLVASNAEGSDEAINKVSITPSSPCWNRLADLNDDRGTHIMVNANDKIYVVGGNYYVGSVEEYDPAADSWTRISDMPTSRGWLFGCNLDGIIYTMGGESFVAVHGWRVHSTVEAYDPATDTWIEKAPLMKPRYWGSAVALDGKIYVIGGLLDVAITQICKTMEIYNPESDSWTEQAIPIVPRFESSVRVVGGKIYVIGGHTMASEVSTVDVYDPVLDQWTSGTEMPTKRWLAADAVVDDKIYVIGGGGTYSFKESSNKAYKKVEVYDPATDSWEEKSPLPIARAAFEACALHNKIYTSAGVYLTSSPTYAECYVYDPLCDQVSNR